MGPTPPDLGRIAFLGLGLIGGSIAMALRRRDAPMELAAWSPSGVGPAEAARAGLIDRAAPSPAACVAGADLVILAGPPLAVLGMLGELGGPLRPSLGRTTITDVASTKAAILQRANGGGLPFVGGHPMAGSERSGFPAARADLFEGRPWVVVPGAGGDAEDVSRVESLARLVGAVPLRMTAEAHDLAAAAISHLPLVVAAALVEAVATNPDPAAPRALAAGGWRDMTRLARGDPEMGAGILATNAGPVADRLRAMRRHIDAWLEILERGEPASSEGADAIRERLATARATLEAFAGPASPTADPPP